MQNRCRQNEVQIFFCWAHTKNSHKVSFIAVLLANIKLFIAYSWTGSEKKKRTPSFVFLQYIKTTFGQTFMLTAGQESKPPVILLHGSCSNSAFWFPKIMALSSYYRVYAVNIIDEAGNSEEYTPNLNSDAFALWMKDVLDALSVEKTIMIGNSLGCWIKAK